jgi:CopG family transcriptional regulator / antitoxin EndoAI
MRTTKTLSITLPPEMLTRAERIARKEHRTMSELVREALRHYERRNWWEEINSYGGKTAATAKVRTEQDVVATIHSLRKEKSSRKRRPPSAK